MANKQDADVENDILQKLRTAVAAVYVNIQGKRARDLMAAAADEIERLRYELDMRVGAEMELAQLHARIEAAPSARIELDKMGVFPEIVDYYDGDVMPLATQGKRVRLVVCDE